MKLKLSLLGILASVSLPCLAEINTQISGFVFNTSFSDSDWYNDRTVGAVNLDMNTDLVSIRGQFTSLSDSPIRRLTLEYDTPLVSGVEAIFKVGRFPRLSSFYNSVTDTPASSGMSLLPQAGYNYRMYTGSFVMMDGLQTSISWRSRETYLNLIASYGKMTVPSQKDLIQELFKRNVPDIEILPQNTYDLALHCESNNWHSYVSTSVYQAITSQIRITPTSTATVNTFHKAHYVLNKMGVKWDSGKVFTQAEYIEGHTKVYNKLAITTAKTDARDLNLVIGLRVKDNHSVYTGYSTGINKTNGTQSMDRVVGYTGVFNPITWSLEYHKGVTEGGSWRKYDSTITHWNSFVSSITYQF